MRAIFLDLELGIDTDVFEETLHQLRLIDEVACRGRWSP